ncbi:MAG TPA: hypothetical protein VGF91_18130, partial [Solirubrobacteraceae bacterium]
TPCSGSAGGLSWMAAANICRLRSERRWTNNEEDSKGAESCRSSVFGGARISMKFNAFDEVGAYGGV